jgi:hypothetical protein
MLLSYLSDIALESRSSQPERSTPPVQRQAGSSRAAEFAICDETIEVTFHDTKQYLGLADPQTQAPTAVRRAAPMAFLVYALVLLWYADAHADAAATAWVNRPWYPGKTSPSFLDMLTALRRAGWRRYLSAAPMPSRRPRNPTFSWPEAVLATA